MSNEKKLPAWNKDFTNEDLTICLADLIVAYIPDVKDIDISIIRVQLRKFIREKIAIETAPFSSIVLTARRQQVIAAEDNAVHNLDLILSKLGVKHCIKVIALLVHSVNRLIDEYKL